MKWRKRMMMTRQEVKDEHKQSEGDPAVKAKRRSLALDRRRRRMMADVPRATLVIANPTHFAIALRYKREEGGAPVVVAKGQDILALKIREIAGQHGIAVIENKPLARSMYDLVEVGELIPPEFYKAVAEVIHYVQSRDTRRPSIPRPDGDALTYLAEPDDGAYAAVLADSLRDVAADLRTIDPVDLVSFIRFGSFPAIEDLIQSSAELFFRHGTLTSAWTACVDLAWDSLPLVTLGLEFRHPIVSVFFDLLLGARGDDVAVRSVMFEEPVARPAGAASTASPARWRRRGCRAAPPAAGRPDARAARPAPGADRPMSGPAVAARTSRRGGRDSRGRRRHRRHRRAPPPAGEFTYAVIREPVVAGGERRAVMRRRTRLRSGKVVGADGAVRGRVPDRQPLGAGRADAPAGRRAALPARILVYDDQSGDLLAATVVWRRARDVGLRFGVPERDARFRAIADSMRRKFYAVR